MNVTTTITKLVQTIMLGAGLTVGNAVWSDCKHDAGVVNTQQTDWEQGNPVAISTASQPRDKSAAELYDLFHDVELNKPDGLGDYVHNYQANDFR